jgi:AAT family amino acid transporter
MSTYSSTLPTERQTTRGLKGRHLQLMGMGGAIGAGFFLGSGSAIHEAGPGLLVAYLLAGIVIYLIMRALGEMAVAYPSAGSFTVYVTEFLGSYAGFVIGWSFWFAAVLGGIADMTAVGILVRHWDPAFPQWIAALCTAAVIYAINMRRVRSFGEAEYWMSMIKIVALLGVMICGLAILLFKLGDVGRHSGVSNLWTHGGFLPQGFSGVFTALPFVIFAYAGMEVLGLAAAETEKPEQTLPQAIRGLVYRVLFIYVGSLTVIMMLFPWNVIDPHGSPFIFVLSHAGLSSAASVVTFVAITAIVSSSNSLLFASSRMLRSMASSGQAPRWLERLSDQGVPQLSVSVSGVIMVIGVVLNYLIPEKLFGYILATVAWPILLAWASITVTHLVYRRALSKGEIAGGSFRMPGAPYTNWIILVAIGFVAVMLAMHGTTLTTFYILVGWFGMLTIAYRATVSRSFGIRR